MVTYPTPGCRKVLGNRQFSPADPGDQGSVIPGQAAIKRRTPAVLAVRRQIAEAREERTQLIRVEGA